MVGSQRKKHLVHEENVLEVIDDALSIQEVHEGAQKVPVQVLGEAHTPGSARDLGNGDDFLE